MIYPYRSYCAIIWGCAGVTVLNKLQLIQKQAHWMLCNTQFYAHSNPLFVRLEILKVEDIYRLQIALFMHKAKFKLLPTSCLQYVNIANVVHAHDTCRVPYFHFIMCHTLIIQKGIDFCGSKLRVSLPIDIQNCCTIGILKHSLSSYFLSLHK